jgi:shikimate kinase
LYREVAHYIVDATNAPAQVVEDILGILAQAAPRLQGGVYT